MCLLLVMCRISTHALTEGDALEREILSSKTHFNSRPHGGRRNRRMQCFSVSEFQLTPSRRATRSSICAACRRDFNSRPHGGRRSRMAFFWHFCISTHALTEGDSQHSKTLVSRYTFQLTPSRRATTVSARWHTHNIVFQLTPSRRATRQPDGIRPQRRNFNSRPHGGRLTAGVNLIFQLAFQLTPSRRATGEAARPPTSDKFQLTPSRRATLQLSGW